MSSISSSLPAGSPTATNDDNAFGDLTSSEFLEIMLTELTYQDPLEPNDSQALLDQVSSLRSIESDIGLADRLEAITRQSELATAGQLIGRFATGLTEQNSRAAGVILSVSRTDDGPVLNLDTGQRVSLNQVDEIIDLGIFDDGSESSESSEGEEDPEAQDPPSDGSGGA